MLGRGRLTHLVFLTKSSTRCIEEKINVVLIATYSFFLKIQPKRKHSRNNCPLSNVLGTERRLFLQASREFPAEKSRTSLFKERLYTLNFKGKKENTGVTILAIYFFLFFAKYVSLRAHEQPLALQVSLRRRFDTER